MSVLRRGAVIKKGHDMPQLISTRQGLQDRDHLAGLILDQRDSGMTLQECADYWGLATRQQARTFWIRGLRNVGRDSEIQTRTIAMRVGNRTLLVDSNDLADTFTFAEYFMPTTFGVEIECFSAGQQGCSRALSRYGVPVRVENYNHETRRHWKVITDASINGGGGAEVVSPVLEGNDGLREMRTTMMALREAGARVNSSCGGHIHIGVMGWMTLSQQAKILKNWWKINRAMEMLVLKGRRDTYYARRLRRETCELIGSEWAAGNTGTAERSVGRYNDLNIHSFSKYGTFENRLHNGTLNGKNHSAWVIFNQAVMMFLANSSQVDIDAIYDPQGLFRGDDESLERNLLISLYPDEDFKPATLRLIEILNRSGFIRDEVAEYLRGRIEWIENQSDRSRGA